MTVHLPLWGFALLSLVGAFLIANRIGRPTSSYDLVSPMFGMALFLAAVLFWFAFYLGRLLS